MSIKLKYRYSQINCTARPYIYTVSHDRLVQKLKEAGIGGSLLVWFTSYLSCRKHEVKINGFFIDEVKMEYEMSQDSVPKPILFIFYTNDLYQLPLKRKLTGCVLTIPPSCITAATKQEVEQRFNEDGEILCAWFQNSN